VTIPGHGEDKINAAYAIGGPTLSVKTVRSLLHIPINHVVNVNFGGFRHAVDRLNCVYVDVDRKYFNDNNPPFGGGPDYATIDVPAGYQKLCGQNALDYVRYRHFDSDLVRAARQQDFLRQAKDQIGVSRIFGDREALLKIFGKYTQTDIRGTTAILRLLKLVALGQPPGPGDPLPGRPGPDIRDDHAGAPEEGGARLPQREGLERPAREGVAGEERAAPQEHAWRAGGAGAQQDSRRGPGDPARDQGALPRLLREADGGPRQLPHR